MVSELRDCCIEKIFFSRGCRRRGKKFRSCDYKNWTIAPLMIKEIARIVSVFLFRAASAGSWEKGISVLIGNEVEPGYGGERASKI